MCVSLRNPVSFSPEATLPVIKGHLISGLALPWSWSSADNHFLTEDYPIILLELFMNCTPKCVECRPVYGSDLRSRFSVCRSRLEMSVAELVRVRSRKSHDFRYRTNQAGCGISAEKNGHAALVLVIFMHCPAYFPDLCVIADPGK